MDLFALDTLGIGVVVEVRGRGSMNVRPILMLSAAKRRRLHGLARTLASRYRIPVRVEFLEMMGRVPRTRISFLAREALSDWGFRPLDFKWRWYRLDVTE